jgi:hypothetical protein
MVATGLELDVDAESRGPEVHAPALEFLMLLA